MSTPFDPFLSAATAEASHTYHNTDYIQLRRSWMNEMRSPELLPFETDAVENIIKALRPQWALISAHQWSRDTYIRDLLVMEADRVSYVLKSYLRIRLGKIQKFARHYVSTRNILSGAELKFAQNLLAVTEQAFSSMFLRHLPPDDEYFQSLVASDDPGGDMVRRPNLDAVVFVKVTDHIGSIRTGPDETADLVKDHSYMIKYALVKDFLHENRLCLI